MITAPEEAVGAVLRGREELRARVFVPAADGRLYVRPGRFAGELCGQVVVFGMFFCLCVFVCVFCFGFAGVCGRSFLLGWVCRCVCGCACDFCVCVCVDMCGFL